MNQPRRRTKPPKSAKIVELPSHGNVIPEGQRDGHIGRRLGLPGPGELGRRRRRRGRLLRAAGRRAGRDHGGRWLIGRRLRTKKIPRMSRRKRKKRTGFWSAASLHVRRVKTLARAPNRPRLAAMTAARAETITVVSGRVLWMRRRLAIADTFVDC